MAKTSAGADPGELADIAAERIVDRPLEHLGPRLWLIGVLIFEGATWMGERWSFPGDVAVQLVLVFGFVALGVRFWEQKRIDGARLALLIGGLLTGFSLDRWLVDAIPQFGAGAAPWTSEQYAGRALGEILSSALHVGPAVALLVWTGMMPRQFRLAFGKSAALFESRKVLFTAGALILVLAGVTVLRFDGVATLPEVATAAPLMVALAVIYALANAFGAEVLYRGILMSALEPVLGRELSNWVQAAAYGIGFGLYGGLALGLPGIATTFGAIAVSYVFGRSAYATGGIGLLVLIHSLATLLTELPLL